jgi:LysM repeat protein
VETSRRAEAARYLAPAAFLVALTVAVLLVHAGLSAGDGGGPDTTPLTGLVTERTTTTKKKTTRTARTTTSARRFYTVQAGDTLDTIAAKFDTTTEKLLALNPGIDPHALTVGQKVRVG